MIADVAAKFAVTVPADLVEFWKQSNGSTLWFGYKELQFFSTDEILGSDIYKLNLYMPDALPICMDGNGNICLARILDGSISGYFVASCGNLGWEDAVEIAKNFKQFISDTTSPEQRLYV